MTGIEPYLVTVMQVRELHRIGDHYECVSCSELGGPERESTPWPCPTAMLVYFPEQRQLIWNAKRDEMERRWREQADQTRAELDQLRQEDHEAYWAEVMSSEQWWRSRKARQALYKPLLTAALRPILRYSDLVRPDDRGSASEPQQAP